MEVLGSPATLSTGGCRPPREGVGMFDRSRDEQCFWVCFHDGRESKPRSTARLPLSSSLSRRPLRTCLQLELNSSCKARTLRSLCEKPKPTYDLKPYTRLETSPNKTDENPNDPQTDLEPLSLAALRQGCQCRLQQGPRPRNDQGIWACNCYCPGERRQELISACTIVGS